MLKIFGVGVGAIVLWIAYYIYVGMSANVAHGEIEKNKKLSDAIPSDMTDPEQVKKFNEAIDKRFPAKKQN